MNLISASLDGYGFPYQVCGPLVSCSRLLILQGSFNGCSMKTEDQLEVIKAIRPDRLLLETGILFLFRKDIVNI